MLTFPRTFPRTFALTFPLLIVVGHALSDDTGTDICVDIPTDIRPDIHAGSRALALGLLAKDSSGYRARTEVVSAMIPTLPSAQTKPVLSPLKPNRR